MESLIKWNLEDFYFTSVKQESKSVSIEDWNAHNGFYDAYGYARNSRNFMRSKLQFPDLGD